MSESSRVMNVTVEEYHKVYEPHQTWGVWDRLPNWIRGQIQTARRQWVVGEHPTMGLFVLTGQWVETINGLEVGKIQRVYVEHSEETP